MGSLARFIDEVPIRKESSITYQGETFTFSADDPALVGGQLLTAEPADAQQNAAHFAKLTRKPVSPQTIAQARQIMAVWQGEGKPGEFELVKLYHRKPELFLALMTCANEVLELDAGLLGYAYGGPKPTAAYDAENPIVRTGLGNSEEAGQNEGDTSISSPAEPVATLTH